MEIIHQMHKGLQNIFQLTLQPMHFAVFLVNAANALTFEVTTVLVIVCSPLSNVDWAFCSPRIGSNNLRSGFDNC